MKWMCGITRQSYSACGTREQRGFQRVVRESGTDRQNRALVDCARVLRWWTWLEVRSDDSGSGPQSKRPTIHIQKCLKDYYCTYAIWRCTILYNITWKRRVRSISAAGPRGAGAPTSRKRAGAMRVMNSAARRRPTVSSKSVEQIFSCRESTTTRSPVGERRLEFAPANWPEIYWKP